MGPRRAPLRAGVLERDRAADAAARTGHDRHLAVEQRHSVPFVAPRASPRAIGWSGARSGLGLTLPSRTVSLGLHEGAVHVEANGVVHGCRSASEPDGDGVQGRSPRGGAGMTGALEARVQRLEDLMAIHQLFIDYGEHLDAGDFDAYSALFAEDGEVLLGPIGRVKGRQAIKDLMVTSLAGSVGSTYHIISSPRVTLDGNTATATVMWTVIGRDDDGQPRLTMVGHHHDELVRVEDRWYFQRRRGVMNAPTVYPRDASESAREPSR